MRFHREPLTDKYPYKQDLLQIKNPSKSAEVTSIMHRIGVIESTPEMKGEKIFYRTMT